MVDYVHTHTHKQSGRSKNTAIYPIHCIVTDHCTQKVNSQCIKRHLPKNDTTKRLHNLKLRKQGCVCSHNINLIFGLHSLHLWPTRLISSHSSATHCHNVRYLTYPLFSNRVYLAKYISRRISTAKTWIYWLTGLMTSPTAPVSTPVLLQARPD